MQQVVGEIDRPPMQQVVGESGEPAAAEAEDYPQGYLDPWPKDTPTTTETSVAEVSMALVGGDQETPPETEEDDEEEVEEALWRKGGGGKGGSPPEHDLTRSSEGSESGGGTPLAEDGEGEVRSTGMGLSRLGVYARMSVCERESMCMCVCV